MDAEHPDFTQAKAIVRRLRSGGDYLGPILELQSRRRGAEAAQKKAEQTLLDRSAHLTRRVDVADKMGKEHTEKLRRMCVKTTGKYISIIDPL